MKAVKRVIITITAMALIMVIGAFLYLGTDTFKTRIHEKQRAKEYAEAMENAESLKAEIEELSQKPKQEIEDYIKENVYVDENETPENTDVSELDDPWEDTNDELNIEGSSDELTNTVSENSLQEEQNTEDSVSGNSLQEKEEIETTLSGNSVSENSVSGNSVSGNSVSGNSVSGNSVSGNSVSGNDLSEKTVSGNSLTLKERQLFRTSYEETKLWAEADEEVIKNCKEDFSGKKIACLGDSITEAINLENLENFKQYSYPTRLGEIMNADEVVNLGIGGSSLGRYWFEPFCDRYTEIPEDTDIIIVLGGANDGFCLTEEEVGNIDELAPHTLYGDVNDLMVSLKRDYPNAEIYFCTPMPNMLHDVLRKDRPQLLSQTVVVDCIVQLAEMNDIPLIDLYNANFLDSHDADIVAEYEPDSVHPNQEGYVLLAKHLAAEIIRIREDAAPADEAVIDEEISDETALDETETDSDTDSDEEDEETDSSKESDNIDKNAKSNESANEEPSDDTDDIESENDEEEESKTVIFARD